jgi:hypothetical protein
VGYSNELWYSDGVSTPCATIRSCIGFSAQVTFQCDIPTDEAGACYQMPVVYLVSVVDFVGKCGQTHRLNADFCTSPL